MAFLNSRVVLERILYSMYVHACVLEGESKEVIMSDISIILLLPLHTEPSAFVSLENIYHCICCRNKSICILKKAA